AYSTGTTDTYGYLKNSGCSNIKYDDDAAGDGKNFSFSSPVTAGTYYITVRHYSSTGLGAYGLRVNFFVPIGPVSVNPTFGTWTSSPRNVSVSSTNASRIYYTIRTTTDGTTPVDPPVPTSSANDGYITGSSGTFQVYASAGQNKKLKVRFRGYNNGGYGATTGSYAYSINLAINNNYIYYPLAANLTVPISSVTIATPFGAQAFGGTHTGVDIMKPINTIVYSIGDGVVRINNTNKNSGSEYLNYWNSFLVIYYPSLDRFVYYGHLSSSLTDNASVKKYQPLGNLRGSYNSNNVRTPSNDHLHLGVKTDYIESGWGYTAAGTSITALEGQGWRDPVKFMRGQ
uniref:M23 family metallopeptidase n=1 Tax=Desulfococcus sp. TaxID=2025834 RepID=UPI003593FC1D